MTQQTINVGAAPNDGTGDPDRTAWTKANANFTELYARAAQFNLINGKITESHAANAATFAVKTLAGSNPSASDPVLVMFPDGSSIAITAALTLTIPAGATLGTTSGFTFRLWFVIFNDAGTARLGVRQCAVPLASTYEAMVMGFIAVGWDGATAISAGATSWVTNYANAAISDKPYRYVAHADYIGGQTTAGQWALGPTRISLIGGSSKLPGDLIQTISMKTTTQAANGGGDLGSPISQAIAQTSSCNIVRVTAVGDALAAVGMQCSARIYRNSTPITDYISVSHNGPIGAWCLQASDMSGSSSTVTYAVYFAAGGGTVYLPYTSGSMILDELMG